MEGLGSFGSLRLVNVTGSAGALRVSCKTHSDRKRYDFPVLQNPTEKCRDTYYVRGNSDNLLEDPEP